MASFDKTCFILGSTGETGKELLQSLCENERFTKIIVLIRQPSVETLHPKVEERIVDFMNLKLYADKFYGGNVAYCCIGTSLSKVKKVRVIISSVRVRQNITQNFYLD